MFTIIGQVSWGLSIRDRLDRFRGDYQFVIDWMVFLGQSQLGDCVWTAKGEEKKGEEKKGEEKKGEEKKGEERKGKEGEERKYVSLPNI